MAQGRRDVVIIGHPDDLADHRDGLPLPKDTGRMWLISTSVFLNFLIICPAVKVFFGMFLMPFLVYPNFAPSPEKCTCTRTAQPMSAGASVGPLSFIERSGWSRRRRHSRV